MKNQLYHLCSTHWRMFTSFKTLDGSRFEIGDIQKLRCKRSEYLLIIFHIFKT